MLFELWDEADEDETDVDEPREPQTISFGAMTADLDPDARPPVAAPADRLSANADARRRSAGEQARRRIEAFIRTMAPRGSAHAFTNAELERLNARRRSRQRFDPYRRP